MEALNTRHPDWQDIVQTTDFLEWINGQPEPVRALMSSDDASEASYLIDTFKQATNPRVEPVEDPQVAQQQSVNQQRLEQSVAPRSRRTATPRGGIPDEFDAAFDYYAGQTK